MYITYHITPNGLVGSINDVYLLNLRGNEAVRQHRRNNKTFIYDLDLCDGYNLLSIFFLSCPANKRRHCDNRSNAFCMRRQKKSIQTNNIRQSGPAAGFLASYFYCWSCIILLYTTTTGCERLSTLSIATHDG